MQTNSSTKQERTILILYFLFFLVLVAWICTQRTPWRDEIISLFYLKPENIYLAMKEEVHHPLMYAIEGFFYLISGQTELNLRLIHGLFSLFGQFCLFKGLRRKFSFSESLLITTLASTVACCFYYGTSIRSNWSMLVGPELIFGFYPQIKEWSKKRLIFFFLIFTGLSLLNSYGLLIALILSSLWYDSKLPSRKFFLTCGFGVLIAVGSYFLKIILYQPHFKAWSFGFSKDGMYYIINSIFYAPSESIPGLVLRFGPLNRAQIYNYITFFPFIFYFLSMFNGVKNISKRYLLSSYSMMAFSLIYLLVFIAEYLGLKVLATRSFTLAYLLFWLSIGMSCLHEVRFKWIGIFAVSSLILVNGTLFFVFNDFPRSGPIEKELAIYTANLAEKENAIILSCDDFFLFKVYPANPNNLRFGCADILESEVLNRRYILPQLTWLGLTSWKKADTKLLNLGFRFIREEKLGQDEFIRVYDPPHTKQRQD